MARYETHYGLSPHGRGKPLLERIRYPKGRSIPARAGETRRCLAGLPLPWVYPRTGGGNDNTHRQLQGVGGLSPHGRGKQDTTEHHELEYRSIPARAGETGRAAASPNR